jgi:hypothetical protein
MTRTLLRRDLAPDDIQAIKAFVDTQRTRSTTFDIVLEGETPGDDLANASAMVYPLAEAGATWWLEDVAIGPYKKNG